MENFYVQVIFYNFLLLLSGYYSYNEVKENKIKNKNKIIICLYSLFFLLGINVKITYDSINYRRTLLYETLSFDEFVFNFISKITNNQFSFFMGIILILELILLIKILKFYKEQALTIFFFYLLFIGYDAINIVRNMLALIILLFGILCYQYGNKIKGILYIISSCFFHKSMILILSLFAFTKISWTKKKYLYSLFVLVILISFISNNILPILLEIDYFSKYKIYLKGDIDNLRWYAKIIFTGPFYLYFFLNIYIALKILKCRDLYKRKGIYILTNMIIIGSVLFIGISILPISRHVPFRIFSSFSIGIFIIIPYYLFSINDIKKRKRVFILIISYCTMYMLIKNVYILTLNRLYL